VGGRGDEPVTMFPVRAGDFALARSEGFAGVVIRAVTFSPYNHVRLITSEHGDTLESLGQGATPGFVRPGDVVVSVPMSDEQRAMIPAIARSLHRTPYSYTGVILLGLARLGVIRNPEGWLATRLRRRDDLFCSQLVDEAHLRVGWHNFTDGRLPHNVTPGHLADLAFRSGWPARVID